MSKAACKTILCGTDLIAANKVVSDICQLVVDGDLKIDEGVISIALSDQMRAIDLMRKAERLLLAEIV